MFRDRFSLSRHNTCSRMGLICLGTTCVQKRVHLNRFSLFGHNTCLGVGSFHEFCSYGHNVCSRTSLICLSTMCVQLEELIITKGFSWFGHDMCLAKKIPSHEVRRGLVVLQELLVTR